MSRRLWGACASEQGLLGAALGPDRLSLRLTDLSEQPVGWGIGFYEHGEPLVRKRPKEERDELDLQGVIAETRSDLLIGHVREPTVGPLTSENTHPFRFRHWLFVHSGTIHQFEAVREQMQAAIPAYLQRSLQGDTDSEMLFYLVLAFLHDSRMLESPRLTSATVADALVEAVSMVDELEAAAGLEEPSPHDVLISNGNFLVVLHRSPKRLLHMTYEAPGRDQVRPRAVLVACDQTAVGSSWTELASQTTFRIRRDLSIESQEF